MTLNPWEEAMDCSHRCSRPTEQDNQKQNSLADAAKVTVQVAPCRGPRSGPAARSSRVDSLAGLLAARSTQSIGRGKRCVEMLAKDPRAENIYPENVRVVLRETKMPWS